MAKLNLLPWRAERRKQRQKEFQMILGLVVVAAVFLVYSISGFYSSELEEQNKRNDYLVAEGKKLDAQIKEIQQLKNTREQLVGRMKLIQDLQGNRPIIVYLFDELVRAVPDDLHFTEVSVKEKRVTIKGVAKTNTRLSTLMRNLGSSDWFDDPQLIKMQGKGEQPKVFEIVVTRRTQPKQQAEG